MKDFIFIEIENGHKIPKSNHPSIKQVHTWGGGPIEGPLHDNITVQLNDGTKHIFSSYSIEETVNEANEYLNNLK